MRRARALELLAVSWCLACQGAPKAERQRVTPAASTRLAAPPAAGSFECVAEVCTQRYPRLPDTGEWRCADSGGVVWCAGGEPAAGVVPGPADAGYRCGVRFGQASGERVCIDEKPDYPGERASQYRCSFAQERGVTRICKRESPAPAPPLSPRALPACWLDADCRSGSCDRGTCRCQSDAECSAGVCRLGSCAEAS